MSASSGNGDTLVQLRVVEGPHEGLEFDLSGPAVIGRSSDSAALVLNDLEVSRRHASLIPEGESLNVEDLGSTNGTFVNGERITGPHDLIAGDRLGIGTSVLEVRLAPVPEQAEADEPASDETDVTEAVEEDEPDAPDAVEEPEPEPAAPLAVEDEEAPADAEAVEEEEPAEAEEEPAKAEEVEDAEPEPAPAAPPSPAAPTEEHDPAAVAKALHARLAESFVAVLRAWSNRDADSMRPFVSEDHLERAREAADALDQAFQVNRIEDVKLRDVAVRRPADGDSAAESVHAYVAFHARDWIEDVRTREVVDGNAEAVQAFLERWTFVPEGRHGWVIDTVESVWTGPAGGKASDEWSGLPEGWYSRRDRPVTWRRWDGSSWLAREPAPTG